MTALLFFLLFLTCRPDVIWCLQVTLSKGSTTLHRAPPAYHHPKTAPASPYLIVGGGTGTDPDDQTLIGSNSRFVKLNFRITDKSNDTPPPESPEFPRLRAPLPPALGERLKEGFVKWEKKPLEPSGDKPIARSELHKILPYLSHLINPHRDKPEVKIITTSSTSSSPTPMTSPSPEVKFTTPEEENNNSRTITLPQQPVSTKKQQQNLFPKVTSHVTKTTSETLAAEEIRVKSEIFRINYTNFSPEVKITSEMPWSISNTGRWPDPPQISSKIPTTASPEVTRTSSFHPPTTTTTRSFSLHDLQAASNMTSFRSLNRRVFIVTSGPMVTNSDDMTTKLPSSTTSAPTITTNKRHSTFEEEMNENLRKEIFFYPFPTIIAPFVTASTTKKPSTTSSSTTQKRRLSMFFDFEKTPTYESPNKKFESMSENNKNSVSSSTKKMTAMDRFIFNNLNFKATTKNPFIYDEISTTTTTRKPTSTWRYYESFSDAKTPSTDDNYERQFFNNNVEKMTKNGATFVYYDDTKTTTTRKPSSTWRFYGAFDAATNKPTERPIIFNPSYKTTMYPDYFYDSSFFNDAAVTRFPSMKPALIQYLSSSSTKNNIAEITKMTSTTPTSPDARSNEIKASTKRPDFFEDRFIFASSTPKKTSQSPFVGAVTLPSHLYRDWPTVLPIKNDTTSVMTSRTTQYQPNLCHDKLLSLVSGNKAATSRFKRRSCQTNIDRRLIVAIASSSGTNNNTVGKITTPPPALRPPFFRKIGNFNHQHGMIAPFANSVKIRKTSSAATLLPRVRSSSSTSESAVRSLKRSYPTPFHAFGRTLCGVGLELGCPILEALADSVIISGK